MEGRWAAIRYKADVSFDLLLRGGRWITCFSEALLVLARLSTTCAPRFRDSRRGRARYKLAIPSIVRMH